MKKLLFVIFFALCSFPFIAFSQYADYDNGVVTGVMDAEDNIYIIGRISDKNFYPASSLYEFYSERKQNNGCYYLAKFDDGLRFVWKYVFGKGVNCEKLVIHKGNLYIAGVIKGKNIKIGDNVFSSKKRMLYLAKFDYDGKMSFVKTYDYFPKTNYKLYSSEKTGKLYLFCNNTIHFQFGDDGEVLWEQTE